MPDFITDDDAVAFKEQLIQAEFPPQWRYATFASASGAATFVDTSPAQRGDEVSSTLRGDGTVGLFFYL